MSKESSNGQSNSTSYSTLKSVSINSLGSLKNIDNINDLVKSNYYEVFNPECVRKKSNWIKTSNKYKFDKDEFDKDVFLNDIEKNSPKLNALLENIKKLDSEDEKKYGKKFKHFIFSDLKSGTYGAKMIASALLAIDMNMAYFAPERGAKSKSEEPEPQQSIAVPSTPSIASNIQDSFGSLFAPSEKEPSPKSSAEKEPSIEDTVSTSPPVPSIESTLSTSQPVPSIESTLSTSRPEPSTESTVSTSPPEISAESTVSTSQPVPSAESTVSTSQPVPSTESTVSTSPPEPSAESTVSTSPPEPSIASNITESIGSLFSSTEKESESETERESAASTEKESAEQKGGKETRLNIRLRKDTDLLKTSQNNFFILSSVDVFGKPISVKMKKEILSKFNQRPDNVYGEYARIIIMDSGFKEGIDLFDIKYVHIFEPQRTMSDQKQVIGRGTRTCGQKGLIFHPTMGWPLYVFNYDINIPNDFKQKFIDSSTGIELYLKALNVDLRLINFANELEKVSIFGAVDYELNKNIHSFKLGSSPSNSTESSITTLTGTSETTQTAGAGTKIKPRSPKKTKTRKPRATGTRIRKSQLVLSEPVQNILQTYQSSPQNSEIPIGNHVALTNYIKQHFAEYTWDDVKMENLCGYAGPEDALQKGGTELIKYSPTQDFIKNYFSPNNPIKGLLLWNSVGTGKTCSAIAAASYSFEPEEYTILWVTRATLKSDIWKNMFEQVCNERLRLEIINGKQIPQDQNERMKLLSKSWKIRPISYKQFSNLVSKQNKYYSDLVKINGEEDPLRKTLIIIDEAHKLYGGSDLSSLEKPDMNALRNALMNSYLVSGNQSVKLLLMTATPITQSPMELIQLLNLMRLPDQQFPEQFNAFSEKYLNNEGLFTKDGEQLFLNEISGYISYLNREKDARQFSQPIIKEVSVPLISNKDKYLIDKYDKEYVKDYFNSDISKLKDEILAQSSQIDDDLKDLNIGRFMFLQNKCNPYDGILKRKCEKMTRAQISDLLKEAKLNTKTITDEIKRLKTELTKQTKLKTTKLSELKNTITLNPEEYEKYKDTLYYTLRDCSKKVKTKNELYTSIENHHSVVAIDMDMAMAEENIKNLNDQIAFYVNASKNRIQNIKKMLKTELTPMETQVLKLVLKEEQINLKKLNQNNITLKKENDTRWNITKKEYAKQKQRAIKVITNKLKQHTTLKQKNEKKLKREELKLRKTLRKQNRIQEEIKNDFVNELVDKYSSKIDENLKILETTITTEEREKETKKQAKIAEKENKKLEIELKKQQRELELQLKQQQNKEKTEKRKKEQKIKPKNSNKTPKIIKSGPNKIKLSRRKILGTKTKPNSNNVSLIRKPLLKYNPSSNNMKKDKSSQSTENNRIRELKHTNNTEDKYNINSF